MNIFTAGYAVSNFGELWGISPRSLARSVMDEALVHSGLEAGSIDALFVGNMLSGVLGNQENLASVYAEVLGRNVPSFRLEAACASGGVALHNAIQSLLAGTYKTVLVLGIEKMTDHAQEEVLAGLMAAGSDDERGAGLTFAGLYAMMARSYMEKYHVSEEDLACIPVKNHKHAKNNPKAQFRSQITVEDVIKSARIADPLRLLDCSPISDGAAAIIITADKKMLKRKNISSITASEVGIDSVGLAKRVSLLTIQASVDASEKAYKKTQLKPKDMQVAEVHDCFSIAEALALEDLGFSKKGRGAFDVRDGKMTFGATGVVVNPSGGLKACGHPVGATGVKQVIEIALQLERDGGRRQVENASVGLAHNVGGSGAVSTVHILQI